MKYLGCWYGTGRLADTDEWPRRIPSGDEITILSYESDFSLAGCSGYVEYEIYETAVTFAFSNPPLVWNKLGVGIGGMSVWEDMDNHDYQSFVVSIPVASGKKLQFDCKCTPGLNNDATVEIHC